jgi:hypothetical protein
VRVNPANFRFEMNDKYIQETCIGYNSGSLVAFGIADLATPKQGEDVEMSDVSEESKDNH